MQLMNKDIMNFINLYLWFGFLIPVVTSISTPVTYSYDDIKIYKVPSATYLTQPKPFRLTQSRWTINFIVRSFEPDLRKFQYHLEKANQTWVNLTRAYADADPINAPSYLSELSYWQHRLMSFHKIQAVPSNAPKRVKRTPPRRHRWKRSPRRRRFAWRDFIVGGFGLATEEDIEELREYVENNYKQVQRMQHVADEMISTLDLTWEAIRDNRKALQNVQSALDGLRHHVYDTNRRTQAFMNLHTLSNRCFKIFGILQDAHYTLTLAQLNTQKVLEALDASVLTRSLLPMADLRYISKLSHPSRDGVWIRPLSLYYRIGTVRRIQSQRAIAYSCELPIVQSTSYNVYEFTPLHAPVAFINDTLRTVLFRLHQHIATDTGSDSAFPVTNMDKCTILPMIVVCPPPIYQPHTDISCQTGMISNVSQYDSCVYDVHEFKDRRTILKLLTDNTVAITTMGTTAILKCHGKTQIMFRLDQGTYIGHYSGDCSLWTDHFQYGAPGVQQRTLNRTLELSIQEIPPFDLGHFPDFIFVEPTLLPYEMVSLTNMFQRPDFTKPQITYDMIPWTRSRRNTLTGTTIAVLIAITIVVIGIVYYYCKRTSPMPFLAKAAVAV